MRHPADVAVSRIVPTQRPGKGQDAVLGGLAKKIWDTYGFDYVPQLLLLGPDRKLIAYNDKLLTKGNLEKIVSQYFGE